MKKTIIFVIFAAFMVLLPLGSVRAAEKIAHPFEDSALLMISSQMRLNGDVESANAGNGHLASVSYKMLALENNNEIDILIQLYVDQINRLRQSGEHTPELEKSLINDLEDKVFELKEQAPKLVEVRKSRRPGGLLGRIWRGVGRVVGKVMEGGGKVVEFAIVEVAPRVLEKVVLGDPLTGALVKGVGKDLLIKRGKRALIREIERRAERGRVVLDDDGDTGDDMIDSLETQGAIEETEIALKEDESTPAPQGVLVYEFTQADAVDTYILELPYLRWEYLGPEPYEGACMNSGLVTDNSTVHLEFDLGAMTVSGWMTGDGHTIHASAVGGSLEDFQASFEIEFFDIPLVPGDGSVTEWTFAGEGLSSASHSGTTSCISEDLENPEFWQVSESKSIAGQITQITGVIYLPESSESDGITLRIETSIVPVNGFYYGFKLTVGEMIELPAP